MHRSLLHGRPFRGVVGSCGSGGLTMRPAVIFRRRTAPDRWSWLLGMALHARPPGFVSARAGLPARVSLRSPSRVLRLRAEQPQGLFSLLPGSDAVASRPRRGSCQTQLADPLRRRVRSGIPGSPLRPSPREGGGVAGHHTSLLARLHPGGGRRREPSAVAYYRPSGSRHNRVPASINDSDCSARFVRHRG